jgi:hypothetical protein
MQRRMFVGVVAGLGVDSAVPGAQGPIGGIEVSRYPAGPLPPDFLGTLRTRQGAIGNRRVVDDPTAIGGPRLTPR